MSSRSKRGPEHADPGPPRAAETSAHVDPAILETYAGLYRSDRDHATISIELKDGNLNLDGRTILRPISAKSFKAGETGPTIEFDTGTSGIPAKVRLISDSAPNSYERVERAHPSRADLEALTGEYASDETETILKVALEANGLVIHQRPDTTVRLTPTYADGFNSSLGSVRFIRDSGGRVIEMSIGGGRMWDLRLQRSQPVAR